jgi:hypothetical protein
MEGRCADVDVRHPAPRIVGICCGPARHEGGFSLHDRRLTERFRTALDSPLFCFGGWWRDVEDATKRSQPMQGPRLTWLQRTSAVSNVFCKWRRPSNADVLKNDDEASRKWKRGRNEAASAKLPDQHLARIGLHAPRRG